MKNLIRTTAGALAAILVASALPAMAQSDEPVQTVQTVQDSQASTEHRLETLRERLLEAIDHRLERIERLQSQIRDSDTVDPRDAAHLTADLSASQGGLTALATRARSASTIEELRAIFEDVVFEHRIYALRTPQTALVLASDFGVAVAGRLDLAADALTEAADRAGEAGFDVSGVLALVDEAQDSTGDGLAFVEPVAGTVLPLEPDDVPDPSRAVLAEAHADMVEGRGFLRSSRDLLREAARLLADIIGADAA